MATTTRAHGGQKYVPLGYVAVAIALAVVLLPTALRPPPDQQQSTASFSPDAPPDQPPELLLQSIRQAQSSTAGEGSRTLEVAIEDEIPPPPPPPPPKRLATRGRCFGEPPRQTESLYSALCVPAWTDGDNGGKTSPGVYPDEIRVALVVGVDDPVIEGRLAREFSADDTDDMHDYKVWQAYFNSRFEFYGRYLQFFILKQSGTEEDLQRASVQRAKVEWDVFTMIGNGAAAVEEAIRQKIVDFGSVNNPVSFYRDAHPYAFSFYMDSWQTRYLATELACKHYAGKPPGDLNERQDVTFKYDEPRTWGLITYQDPTRTGATGMYRELMAKCGVEFELTHEYNLTDNQQSIAGSMAKMKAAGVTTIIIGTDGLTIAALTAEAERIAYYPEYIHAGTGGIDGNGAGRLMDDNQAKHWIGLSPNEIPREDADQDWYRAYKEIDPEGEPDASFFRSLQQISGGIQMAGPRLTPETFWEGLKKQPYRVPDPVWSIGGGYREPDDFTYMDYVSLIWFDADGDDPDSSLSGAWCHVWEGKRVRVGEVPAEPIPWFDQDACITTPEQGVQG